MKTVARTALALGVVLSAAACTSSSPAAPAPAAGVPATSAPGATGLTTTEVHALPGTDAEPFDKTRRLSAPKGWTVSVWARVPKARLLAWTADGRLLVSRPGFGDVITLTPRGDAAPEQSTLTEGLTQPHGLAFHGNTLYVAESNQIDSFTYASGAVSGRRVVAAGLPDAKSPELGGAYAHALKSVAVGKGGELYFSIGSSGNVSVEDRDADPERAAILRMPAGGGKPAVFARGVRNGTGLAIDPDGGVWTAVNNRDNVAYPNDDDYDGDGKADQGKVMQSYVNDHPLEPLARLTEGRDLGWPYCNPDRPGAPFVRDFQNNADGSKLDCAALKPVEQGMGAHSAPLGLSFVTGLPGAYGNGALVGIHGSWNRKPPRPPEVSFFAWRDGTLGPQQTLLTGFQNADGSRWGRPVMAVRGPDGALYVSDDFAGAIYRVVLR
ncbi:gluconolaconase [Actinoplanes sp. TBRC 11911]|uniref:PQQ-dependent sugar dehydrogenase n=1 Tax=Actinoplanes sp. TBRC 11911 TaxID=2729386 RepID=UPI00145F22D8|nr:gluconolaconase [Actinoplanes sp. TBRC 11911]NMO56355.1 gluconolaconase [Actinoplanes sp. TBRC 11911]